MNAAVEFARRTQIVARLKYALLIFWVPLVLAALVPAIVVAVAPRFEKSASEPLPPSSPSLTATPPVVGSPPAQDILSPPAAPSALEDAFWQSIKTSSNPVDFKAYLGRFPNGVFTELAQNRLEALTTIKVALELIAAGDIPAARILLRRAYERGEGRAALELGGTYDPRVLNRLNVAVDNSLADAAQARDWYLKAAGLGSVDALDRISQLDFDLRRKGKN
jgi:hypothetical protein